MLAKRDYLLRALGRADHKLTSGGGIRRSVAGTARWRAVKVAEVRLMVLLLLLLLWMLMVSLVVIVVLMILLVIIEEMRRKACAIGGGVQRHSATHITGHIQLTSACKAIRNTERKVFNSLARFQIARGLVGHPLDIRSR